MLKAGIKIPWIYSGITIGMVVIAGIVFYFLASGYIQELYFEYLVEKARVLAVEKYEKDELSPAKYRRLLELKEDAIPTEKELFVNLSDTAVANKIFRDYLKENEIQDFYREKSVNFTHKDEVGVLITYTDDAQDYAILVIGRNPYGEEIAQTIGWGILVMVLVAAIVLYLISRLYAIRIVERINSDFQTEKLFVNNASHEINNPLTAIQGECEITLLKERSAEEYKSSLERISAETDRIIRIMSQLLMFSHVRSEEKDEEEEEKVQMSEFLQQFVADNIDIIVNSDFSVSFREDMLTIAVRNIINNALKYSHQERVTVIADKGTLSVCDKGVGISKEDLQHIFEPFFRAGNIRHTAGHGIGLTLSKAIIEKSGGRIVVTSKPHEGTVFTIAFKKYFF